MSVPCRKLCRGSTAHWKHREAKRACRGRKKCVKLGHVWMHTYGSMTLMGELRQYDSGQICRRCGLYEELENIKVKVVNA